MINPETVSESFIKWLEQKNIGTFGSTIFLNRVPETAPDSVYWLVTSGGNTIQKLKTGEKVKQYFTTIFYRSSSPQDVERKTFKLEELIDKPGCLTLTGFEIIEVEVSSFPSDNDLDSIDRSIGLLQANIQIYKT